MLVSTPFKKSNATRLWSIIFLLSWICIRQIRYPWKACLFALRSMPYLFGWFHWGVCRMSKLGAMSKRKSCKIDWILWEMRAMSCFVPFLLWAYALVPTAPGPIHCTKILRNKHHADFQIVMQFWNIYFVTLRLIIITLRTFLTVNIKKINKKNNIPIKRKINRLSNDTQHDEYNLIDKLVSSIKAVVQFCNIYLLTLNPI